MTSNNKPAINTILFPFMDAVVIGVLAGLGAVFFRWMIEVGINLLWAGEGGFVLRHEQVSVIWRVGIPVLVGPRSVLHLSFFW